MTKQSIKSCPLEVYVRDFIFDWYLNNQKTYELRNNYGRYHESLVIPGRALMLYKGNSGIVARGNVGQVVTASLDHILSIVKLNPFGPFDSEAEFRELVVTLLGRHERYIAFQMSNLSRSYRIE